MARGSLQFILAAALVGATAMRAEDPVSVVAEPGGFRTFWQGLMNADGSSDAISVSSQTYNGYKRTKLPDGRFRPETYAFGEGGYGGGTVAGQPADRVPFLKVVHTIAGPLSAQNYVPSQGAENTELMILVFWGVTQLNGMTGYQSSTAVGATGPSPTINQVTGETGPTGNGAAGQLDDASMTMIGFDNYWREETNNRNARILGYSEDYKHSDSIYGFRQIREDLRNDLEDPRYYVVLQAYDFQKARKEKRLVMLWSTRYSIRERNNDFDRDLAAMSRRAARYFGQSSHGLQRNLSFRGTVDIGELKVIEFDTQAVREIGPPEAGKPAEQTEPPKR